MIYTRAIDTTFRTHLMLAAKDRAQATPIPAPNELDITKPIYMANSWMKKHFVPRFECIPSNIAYRAEFNIELFQNKENEVFPHILIVLDQQRELTPGSRITESKFIRLCDVANIGTQMCAMLAKKYTLNKDFYDMRYHHGARPESIDRFYINKDLDDFYVCANAMSIIEKMITHKNSELYHAIESEYGNIDNYISEIIKNVTRYQFA